MYMINVDDAAFLPLVNKLKYLFRNTSLYKLNGIVHDGWCENFSN